MTAERAPGEAVSRVWRLELYTLTLSRAAGCLNILFGVVLNRGSFVVAAQGPLLGLVVLAESVALASVCWRRGRLNNPWLRADFLVVGVAILVNALILAPRGLYTWGFFMYPFSLVAGVAYGLTARTVAGSVGMGVTLAACYVGGAAAGSLGPAWNLVPNGLSYPAITATAFLVGRELRRTATVLDESRATAERTAAELGREREHRRYVRLLHDRVVQTMELLAGGTWGLPAPVDQQIRREAAWLRTLVETGEPPHPGGLLDELDTIASTMGGRGLHVTVTGDRGAAAGLRLPGDLVAGVLDAAEQALVNVTKHAAVDSARVEVTVTPHEVVVAVSDAGRGFRPDEVARGVGVASSIRARMTDLGGTARVDSAPGAGTTVELRLPTAGRRGAAPA